MKTCKQCQHSFPIEEEDLKFYEKMEVPEPTMCPRCRQQQRLAFRNEINFFHRKCDKTGRQILSMYAPDSPYKVYDHEEWWKDDWDPMDYGREFDFNRPFFEQFGELQRDVPRMSLNVEGSENSYFTNYALRNKNCYLISTSDYNEECSYGRFCDRNFHCMDLDYTYDSRFCYESLNVHKGTSCFFSEKIDSCSDVYFCYDLRNCHNCIFSVNQRNQSYLVFNKKVTREEFERVKNELSLSSWSGIQKARQQAAEFMSTQPRKFLETIQCEDSLGDYLKNCKNAQFCFDGYDLHDVKYCSNVFKLKDCYDWDFVGDRSERCYFMASSAARNMNCRFCMNTWEGCTDMTYCDLCLYDQNCFGCVGLRRKKYCILNKQYTKEEYEKLVPRIIEHMKRNKEWGEFFPVALSPFTYNDSVAQEYYPLSKKEAQSQGFSWRDEEEKDYQPQTREVPDDIKDVTDGILNEILSCGQCRKNFRITAQELKFYREMKLPVPQRCWLCRHKARMAKKNPRVIQQRKCSRCEAPIVTTYSPERPEPVYCEKCYLEFVA
ncbi:hypothetical protein HYW83_06495 [Candidatus Peregrinibacteria bacterium]|nr:hypothetical protein [Candidatus Peregrinibacteria bacterium]